MKENPLKNRTVYYDYLRVAATMAVILLHVAATNWSNVDVNSKEWCIFNFYDSVARWGVPVFVMISGALFLSRDSISIKSLFFKYVFRMFTAFVTWSFIYYLLVPNEILERFVGLFRPGKLEKFINITTSYYHLWFVPMIAGIYICLPIIKKISEDDKISNYFLIISFIFWILLPQISQLIDDLGNERMILVKNAIYGNINNMNMNFVCSYVFYFVLGYRISRLEFEKKERIAIYLAGGLGFLFTIIIDWFLTIKLQRPVGTYYSNTCINVCFEAVAVFLVFKSISFKQAYHNKIIVNLSKWSFGAYLVHAKIIEMLSDFGINTLRYPAILVVPLIVCIVAVISFAISAILNNISILKRFMV